MGKGDFGPMVNRIRQDLEGRKRAGSSAMEERSEDGTEE